MSALGNGLQVLFHNNNFYFALLTAGNCLLKITATIRLKKITSSLHIGNFSVREMNHYYHLPKDLGSRKQVNILKNNTTLLSFKDMFRHP